MDTPFHYRSSTQPLKCWWWHPICKSRRLETVQTLFWSLLEFSLSWLKSSSEWAFLCQRLLDFIFFLLNINVFYCYLPSFLHIILKTKLISNPKFAVFFSSHHRSLKAMRRPVKGPWTFYQIVSVPQPRTSTILTRQHLTFVQQLPVNNMAMKNFLQTSLRRLVVS